MVSREYPRQFSLFLVQNPSAVEKLAHKATSWLQIIAFASPMNHALFISVLIAMTLAVWGGESALTITYQPLDGLGSGEITISQVTCHDWNSHSGLATAIGLISVPNVPPTNNPAKATVNLNLASVCGVYFSASDIGDPRAALGLTLDASKFTIPKMYELPREDIIRASLECLRLCLPDKLRETPVMLEAAASDKEWLSKIVGEFNAHDRRKVFYTPRN